MPGGQLFLVGTPIGNLEDITLRALRVLREVDLIAAEDTRRTRELLSHYDIHTPLISYHRHNLSRKIPRLLGLLKEGKRIALVTDAGMPGIADPGAELVRETIAAGFEIIPVPGPSALVTALVISGLSTDRFIFEGFLPREPARRLKLLQSLAFESRTLIFYEAPHRLVETLEDLAAVFGERQLVVARELTKKFETAWRGTPAAAAAYFKTNPPRGEVTLVVAGAPPQGAPDFKPEDAAREVRELAAKGYDLKEAMRVVALKYRRPRRDIYRAVLEAKDVD
ncbi:MAG: rRNA (cytidine1402-2-O)-methyltransferase [Clostridia bacterium]|nr:rRNA (cytidine1402-2-O)-methyltransferase [Clostridia bacterium]